MHWRRKWRPSPVFLPGEPQGAWWAAVYGVAQSQTWLKRLSSSSSNRLVTGGFPVGSVVKNLPANTGDMGSIPGLGRSPGEVNGNPLQHSYLGNPTDRGARQAIAREAAKSWMQLATEHARTHSQNKNKQQIRSSKLLLIVLLIHSIVSWQLAHFINTL